MYEPKTITIRADGSKIVLSYTVYYWADRQKAGDTAWAAPGTFNVQNNLVVT